MKKILFLSMLASTMTLSAIPLPVLQEKVTFHPIHELMSSTPPKEALWIQGKLVAQEEDAVYVLLDHTDAIHIFLSADELTKFTLTPGEHIAVWGKVDKSPVGRNRNEFYVEKMFDLHIPIQELEWTEANARDLNVAK